MVIRHAEMPNGDPGVMPDGSANPEALTATGWKRANALVGLFDPANGMPAGSPLATPERLFASGSNSLRPVQTTTPLAGALDNLPMIAFEESFSDRGADETFASRRRRGAHDIHMMQGSSGSFASDNRVNGDGALFFRFAGGETAALFVRVSTQSLHTDGRTGAPL